jgi:hypothetical protein
MASRRPQTSYTLKHIYPALAIVEDENPPAYDPVPVADPDAADNGDGPTNGLTDGKPRPVTSSLRSIFRALRANGGFLRSSLRGLSCFLAQYFATGAVTILFSAALPRHSIFASLAGLLASLAMVQLSTAWVHIVISPPSPRHFYQRLPPFRRTFDAAAGPVALYWLAATVTDWVPLAVALALGLRIPNFMSKRPYFPEEPQGGAPWKGLVVMVVAFACQLLFRLPAHVVLVRVQSSLLPVEDDTIVPFDRSFEGKVEPAVVSGKGYASISEAWITFGRSAWRRLIILYIKLYFLSIAIYIAMAAIVGPQVAAMIKKGANKGGPN